MYITTTLKKVIFIVLLLNGCQNGKFLGLDEKEWTIIGAVGAITATAYALCKGGKCKLPDSSNYYAPKKVNNCSKDKIEKLKDYLADYLEIYNKVPPSLPSDFSYAPSYRSFRGCCSYHNGMYRIGNSRIGNIAICCNNRIICVDDELSPTCDCLNDNKHME